MGKKKVKEVSWINLIVGLFCLLMAIVYIEISPESTGWIMIQLFFGLLNITAGF